MDPLRDCSVCGLNDAEVTDHGHCDRFESKAATGADVIAALRAWHRSFRHAGVSVAFVTAINAAKEGRWQATVDALFDAQDAGDKVPSGAFSAAVAFADDYACVRCGVAIADGEHHDIITDEDRCAEPHCMECALKLSIDPAHLRSWDRLRRSRRAAAAAAKGAA